MIPRGTFLCLLLCCWASQCFANVTIRLNYLSNAWHEFHSVDISGKTYIESADVGYDTTLIYIAEKSKYVDITEFRFMPKVVRVNGFAIGQSTVPLFTEMPSLRFLNFSRNSIRLIPRAALYRVPQVEEIFFDENLIEVIEDKSFGPQAAYVSLNCNKLRQISNSWFVDPTSIIYLHLKGNYISHINRELVPMTNLSWLDMSHNRVIQIEDKSFSGTPTWYLLDLSYNKITELKYSFFKKEAYQSFVLDISNNHLSYLPDRFASRLNLTTISVWGNPWQCPCLEKIQAWKITVLGWRGPQDGDGNNPSCVYSDTFSRKCVRIYDQRLYELYRRSFNENRETVCVK